MYTFQPLLIGGLAILLIVAFVFTGAALAQDEPDLLPATGAARNNSFDYITQLDNLRASGSEAATQSLAYPEVYEFSSDLQRLNADAASQSHLASHPETANDYVTRLDELRGMSAQ